MANASAVSVNKGEPITLYMSANARGDQRYSIGVYRVGYYQGLGGRLMMTFPSSGFAAGMHWPASVHSSEVGWHT